MNWKRLLQIPFLLTFLFVGSAAYSNPVAAVGPLSGITVCLDPGHGGSDPGAVNASFGLNESEINLDVSFGLRQLFEGEGAIVAMTRTTDQFLTNKDRYTFCNGEQAAILISVHTNSVTDPTRDGSLTLYGPGKSPDLAQAIYDEMFPALRDTAPSGVAEFTGFGIDRFASGVLFKSNMPAAMIEPLFMSHPAEAGLLVTPIFDPITGEFNQADCTGFSCRRGQIAQSIFAGAITYLNGQSGGDNQPAVIIVNPAESAVVSDSQPVQIAVSDEDAPDNVTVEWNISGGSWQLAAYNATSGYFEATWDTAEVNDGAHVINARAKDSSGQTGSDANSVTVQSNTLPAMHVGDLNGSSEAAGQGGKWNATVTITLHDASEMPVANATVTGLWSSGTNGSGSCVTNSSGQCSITKNNIKRNSNSVTLTVTTVAHGSLTYDSSANHDPDGDSNGTVIIVSDR